MNKKSTGQKSVRTPKSSEKMWGRANVEAGFLILPSILLERQKALDLNADELNVLLHLVRRWWEKDRLPHPGKKGIADCMGVSPRTVQRHLTALEGKGLIRRKPRRRESGGTDTNAYDLSGLVAKLTPLAEEFLADRDAVQEANARRKRRKKAVAQSLAVVAT